MPQYAIIDVGSNSIVLSTYDAWQLDGKWQFELIHYQSNTARLATYVQDGIMTADGIQKAVEVIGGYLAIAKDVPAENIGIFATAAIRNSKNAQEIVSSIQEQCGHAVEILSGETEAHLSFVGAISENPTNSGLLMDMGGASTELTLVENEADALCVSLPFGALAVANQFISDELPSPSEIDAIADATRQHLNSLDPWFNTRFDLLMGSSGSIRSALHMAEIEGDVLGISEVERLVDLARFDQAEFRRLIELHSPNRVRTAAPGCIVLLEVMKWAQVESILVCRSGVREGFLLERMLGPTV